MSGQTKEMTDPFLGPKSGRKTSEKFCCVTAIIFAFASAALAVALALTWIKELPCAAKKESIFPNDWIRFFHLADVHYDPLYNASIAARPSYCRASESAAVAQYAAPYGRIGCDSPKALVQNAISAMKSADETVDFVVFTGDLSGHYLFNDTVLEAIGFVTDELRETFPTTYVFPCLGNNDVPADYYIPTPPTNWYEDVLALWKDFILCSSCTWRGGGVPTTEAALNKTFLVGGYYRVDLSSKLTLLVLNTVYYSNNVRSEYRTPLFESTASGQLTWLTGQLAAAEKSGRKVLIAGHVPPGIDPYSLTSFWVSNATQMYIDITARRYPHVIAGQLFAHMHKDDFKIFFSDQKNPSVEQSSAMLFTSAVSPVYNNNPNFRLMYLDDETQAITDYRQWYLNLALADEFTVTHWMKEYTFSESFPSDFGQPIDSQRISYLSNQLLNKTDDSVWLNYLWHRQAEYLPDSKTFSQFLLHCVIRNWDAVSLDACRQALPFISG